MLYCIGADCEHSQNEREFPAYLLPYPQCSWEGRHHAYPAKQGPSMPDVDLLFGYIWTSLWDPPQGKVQWHIELGSQQPRRDISAAFKSIHILKTMESEVLAWVWFFVGCWSESLFLGRIERIENYCGRQSGGSKSSYRHMLCVLQNLLNFGVHGFTGLQWHSVNASHCPPLLFLLDQSSPFSLFYIIVWLLNFRMAQGSLWGWWVCKDITQWACTICIYFQWHCFWYAIGFWSLIVISQIEIGRIFHKGTLTLSELEIFFRQCHQHLS